MTSTITLTLSKRNLAQLLTLPATLQELHCNDNELTEFPNALPPTLLELYCFRNKLTELPDLPTTLRTLHCDNNKLTELPNLPATLKLLSCDNNKLTELPDLPATLRYLNCRNNELTELPDLPATLRLFYYYDNPQLNIIYPLLNQMRNIQEKITYVNEINSGRRIQRIQQRTSLLKSQIMEEYAMKTMHPKNLQPLLDDPNKEVDEFMCEYIGKL